VSQALEAPDLANSLKYHSRKSDFEIGEQQAAGQVMQLSETNEYDGKAPRRSNKS
jgi:hypothetical protein